MINFLKITIVIKIKRLKEKWRQLYDQCQKQKNLKQKKWFKKHVIRYHNNSKSNVPRQPLWNMSASGTFHLYPCLWYHQDTSNRQLYNRFRKNARYQQRFQENRVGGYRILMNLILTVLIYLIIAKKRLSGYIYLHRIKGGNSPCSSGPK